MRTLQASPLHPNQAIALAQHLGCEAIAWDLRAPCEEAIAATQQAGLRAEGWWQAARDLEAAAAHPEWLHAPQHHEWLRRFENPPRHPALVGGWIGLNTVAAFAYAQETLQAALHAAPWVKRLWLSEIQGPPMGCGCGNPCCRSWDNAPGEKLAPTAYQKPEVLFPFSFWQTAQSKTTVELIALLCPECERGVCVDSVEDPDGPDGTDLCQGIPCVRPCALDYWPRLLDVFRAHCPRIGLLALTEALGKAHPVYGQKGWAQRAHQHYGTDLLPVVELRDAARFTDCLIATAAPQSCWPVEPPEGYVPNIPPIMCGYCPPEP